MKIKTENWNGHDIRFVLVDEEWMAVAKDVAVALGYTNTQDAIGRHCKGVVKRYPLETKGGIQEVRIIKEGDMYRLTTRSKLESAIQFEEWLFDEMLPSLRKKTGLEGFEVFRMLDKEHQKEAMRQLSTIPQEKEPKVNYIKANSIANKAVSLRYGFEKSVKKDNMTPEMLADRQPILDDVVELMSTNSKFDLGVSVSEKVYNKYH